MSWNIFSNPYLKKDWDIPNGAEVLNYVLIVEKVKYISNARIRVILRTIQNEGHSINIVIFYFIILYHDVNDDLINSLTKNDTYSGAYNKSPYSQIYENFPELNVLITLKTLKNTIKRTPREP